MHPTFGQQLRRYREAQGWTRKTLAHYAGCAVVTLQKIERDERRPSIELARLLVAALQLSDADAQQLLTMLQPPAHAIAPTPSARDAPDFFGRTSEQQHIYTLLQGRQTRLLTLTGIGGVGKTRLAQNLLPRLRHAFPHGVYTVELAAIHHLDLLLPAVARALNCPASGGMAAQKQIADFVGEKEVLIYLDNFEQLLDGAAELTHLLGKCPNLCLLVTSREALRTPAETVLTVHPLSLPELDAPTNVTAIAAWPAVALFVARAQNVRPDFTLTEANVEAVTKVCALLDGLPLAIELVAARIRIMSPQLLLARLSTAAGAPRIGLVAQDGASLPGSQPARHRTLRESLAWSVDLLNAAERLAFAQLAVFQGGFDLPAAEALLPLEHEQAPESDLYVWDLLSSLLDKQLLTQRASELGPPESPRFFMLETVRQFAAEQLGHSDQEAATRHRHAIYYCQVAQHHLAQMQGGEEVEQWLNATAQEMANMHSAMAWDIHHGRAELALRTAIALRRFWWIRGYWQQGVDWLERGLAAFGGQSPADQSLRARALRCAGDLYEDLRKLPAARTHLMQALALAQTHRDVETEALVLSSLCSVCCSEGRLAEAEAYMLQRLTHDLQTGNQRNIAISYGKLGEVAMYEADYAKVDHYFSKALDLQRAHNDKHSIMITCVNWGYAALEMGQLETAHERLAEGLTLARLLGNQLAEATILLNHAELAFAQEEPQTAYSSLARSVTLAHKEHFSSLLCNCFYRLAQEVAKAGDVKRAANLLGATQRVQREHQMRLEARDAGRITRALALWRTQHGATLIDDGFAVGATMSVTEAVAHALQVCQEQLHFAING